MPTKPMVWSYLTVNLLNTELKFEGNEENTAELQP